MLLCRNFFLDPVLFAKLRSRALRRSRVLRRSRRSRALRRVPFSFVASFSLFSCVAPFSFVASFSLFSCVAPFSCVASFSSFSCVALRRSRVILFALFRFVSFSRVRV